MLQEVKEALDWAYRSGYFRALEAAEELAQHLGETVGRWSLGTYGDKLVWRPKPPESIEELAREEE